MTMKHPPMIVSMDPGLRACGIAVFRDGVLSATFLPKTKTKLQGIKQCIKMAEQVASDLAEEIDGESIDDLVIERMVPRREKPAAWPALIDLSLVSGGVGAIVASDRTHTISPSRWTQNKNKKVNRVRILNALSEEEVAVLEEAMGEINVTSHKELYDAIGIGLYFLGRI